MYTAILIMVLGWSALGQVAEAPAAHEAAGDSVAESVEVRYARAQLQLAEANLRRVEASNQQVARSVPSTIVGEYRSAVAVAKARLEEATAGKRASDFRGWLERAEAERKSAETAWKSAAAANERMPGTFGTLDIERFRLRAEVARLQLERGQSLASAGREAQIEWEVDLLDNQVQRLKEESNLAAPVIGIYPVWRW